MFRTGWLTLVAALAAAVQPGHPDVPENVYRAELVTYPGPWSFQLGKSSVILVADEELEALADPDKPINLSLGKAPRTESLRQVCERARAQGQRTLILAFDHFFSQYRLGQAAGRRLGDGVREELGSGHAARSSRRRQCDLSGVSPA